MTVKEFFFIYNVLGYLLSKFAKALFLGTYINIHFLRYTINTVYLRRKIFKTIQIFIRKFINYFINLSEIIDRLNVKIKLYTCIKKKKKRLSIFIKLYMRNH